MKYTLDELKNAYIKLNGRWLKAEQAYESGLIQTLHEQKQVNCFRELGLILQSMVEVENKLVKLLGCEQTNRIIENIHKDKKTN